MRSIVRWKRFLGARESRGRASESQHRMHSNALVRQYFTSANERLVAGGPLGRSLLLVKS
jgi:hypothetical protein